MTGTVRRYVGAVVAAGVCMAAVVVSLGNLSGAGSVRFILLAVLLFVCELLPITIRRKGEQDEIIASTTFAYAIVLTFGGALAVVAQLGASIVADVVHRKPPWKVAFNAAQYTISITICAGELAFLGLTPGAGRLTGEHMPAMLLGAMAFFVSNVVITGVGLALAQNEPIVRYLARDLAFQAVTDGILLALAPVVVVVADQTLWLVPALVLPLAGVYRSARISLENLQLVEKLEDSLSNLTELNRQNEHMALHDGLTGLPNRILFRDRVHQAVLRAKRSDGIVAVMLIDLDRFKEINDTLGHHNGDILLQQVGPRLRHVLRESDTIARLGGDEFALLLPEVSGATEARDIAGRIRRTLENPFPVGEVTLDVEASVGIALYPVHGSDVDVMLQRADQAMYVAKSNREGSRVYAPRDDQYDPARLALLGQLRRAIDEGQLTMHFQPKADLRTGNVQSVEALMRWLHPQRGLVLPREFIPFAEHTTLIRPLTHYAVSAALAQVRAWRDAGIHLRVAVNLSVRNLLDAGLPAEIAMLLRHWQLPADVLELEITESVLMAEPTRALRVLAELNELGVGLSLDDFGTGYSSLAYLRQLPVDEIKIDRSFVTNMLREPSDAKIVRSTIDLARNLGLRVVAEGVEDEATWERLTALECDVAQGFYLSPPIHPTDLTRWWVDRPGAAEGHDLNDSPSDDPKPPLHVAGPRRR